MIYRGFLSLVFCVLSTLALADDLAFDQRANWQHQDTWMHHSDGDVGVDLDLASSEGKSLMILWEQQGCHYCDRLRGRNFQNPVIRDMLVDNFLVVPLDIYGSRHVRARDGKVMTESELARRLKVTGTPTTVVFNSGGVLRDVARTSVAFRMPGYLTSFHYFTVLAYFLSDQHEDMSLREYTQLQEQDFRRRGLNPDRW